MLLGERRARSLPCSWALTPSTGHPQDRENGQRPVRGGAYGTRVDNKWLCPRILALLRSGLFMGQRARALCAATQNAVLSGFHGMELLAHVPHIWHTAYVFKSSSAAWGILPAGPKPWPRLERREARVCELNFGRLEEIQRVSSYVHSCWIRWGASRGTGSA